RSRIARRSRRSGSLAAILLCPSSAGRRLVDVFLGLVGFALQALNLGLHVAVGLGRRHVVGRDGAGVGCGRQTILALVVGQLLEPSVHLLAEVVMHLLQIGHFHVTVGAG